MMLEYLLVRPADREDIFANHRCRFLVLDEVHTYRGTLGSNIALLVRRLRAHLGRARQDWNPNPPAEAHAARYPRLVAVGPSATIQSASGDPAERDRAVQDFFARLAGVEPTWVLGPQPLAHSRPRVGRRDRRASHRAGPGARGLSGTSQWVPDETLARIRAWEEAPLLDDLSVTAGYRATVVNLGLIGVAYHRLGDYVRAEGTPLAHSLGIGLEVLEHVARCALDEMRVRGCLSREMLRYHPKHLSCLERGDLDDPRPWLDAFAAGVGSPLELRFLRLFEQHGFPPARQVPIAVDPGAPPITIADFAVPERRLAIYVDGAAFHVGQNLRRDRIIRARLRNTTPPWRVEELRAADLAPGRGVADRLMGTDG